MASADAPPSYDSIISKIDDCVRNDVSVEGLSKAFGSLSDNEKVTLASRTRDAPAPLGKLKLDDIQQKKFIKGFAEGLDGVKGHLNWQATKCAEQCKKVAADFLALTNKLSSVSSLDGSEESKKLVKDFQDLEKVIFLLPFD
jgi:hypothetical protein